MQHHDPVTSVTGRCFFKRAVRNSSCLKLVLPPSLHFLEGLYGTRRYTGGVLEIRVGREGEVKFCRLARNVRNVVVNVGPLSRFFSPGQARFIYKRGLLFVSQP